MAQQLKSAGDGTTSGNVAQIGTQTLPEASQARPGEGSFVCTQDWLDARCTQLSWRIGELFDLIAVFRVASEIVEQHNNDNGPALYEVERLLRSGLCGLQRIGDDLGEVETAMQQRDLPEGRHA